MLLALQPRPPKPEPFYPHLLPPNSTPLERALSGPTGRLTAIPVKIAEVFNWQTCPTEFLPWLAFEHGVDFWDNDWSEGRKREIIRDSVAMHRSKGTLRGAKWFCSYADAQVTRAIVPPQSPFWAPLDQANIDNWEATLPQIRIYPRREPGTGDGFYFGDYTDDDAPTGGGYYEENRAPEDGGDRKVFREPITGAETEIDWIGAVRPAYGTHTELGLPGIGAVDHIYADADHFDAGHYPAVRDTDASVVTLPPQPPEEIVNGWYRVTRATPDYITRTGNAGKGVFYHGEGILDDGPDNAMDGDYYGANDAPWEVYRRWHIFSPDATRGDPDGWSYYGDFRYGQSPHTAELWVDIPETAPLDECYDETETYLRDTDLRRLWQVADALETSRAERDQILIETELRRRPKFGDRRMLGDGLKFGEYIARTH